MCSLRLPSVPEKECTVESVLLLYIITAYVILRVSGNVCVFVCFRAIRAICLCTICSSLRLGDAIAGREGGGIGDVSHVS